MSINRYYTPAQSQPFDPFVVDTATMYGNLRQAGYDNLLAKQKLDIDTQNEIGKTLDSLKAFAPENTEVFIPLNNGGSKTEKSKLPTFYNQMTSEIYKGASDIAAKYNNNYTSPEAQKEISEYLQSVKSILPKLQELKTSDKALGEQNKIGEEHLKNTPLDALQGTLGEHVKSVRDKWVNPNDFNFHTSLSAPTKGVNMSEAINKYIGDNLIRNYGDEAYKKLGVVVGADGIPTFDISKTSTETRQRLYPELFGGSYDKKGNYISPKKGEDQGIMGHFIDTNKEHLHNSALEGLQYKELTEGLKDQKDAENTYNEGYTNRHNQLINRGKEFVINDLKTKTDLTSKFVPNSYAKDAGIGIYRPTINDFTPKDLPAMDNYNDNQPLTKLNDKGEIYVNNPIKLIFENIGNKGSAKTTDDFLNIITKEGGKLDDVTKSAIEDLYETGKTDKLNRSLTLKGYMYNVPYIDKNNKRQAKLISIEEGDKLDKNDPKAIKQVLTDNPELNKALKSHGFDLTVNPATGKAPQADPIKFQKALKEYQEARENTSRVFTKEYKDNSLLNSGENENLNNSLTSSRIKFAKKETLPDDLPDLETINGGIDGKTFTDWLSTKHNVKYHTDGVIPSTGLFDANTAYHRVIEYSDNKGEPPKRLDFFQTTPFTNTQEGVDANVLNDISKQILSGKLDINGEYAGHKYNLQAKYNPNKKSYDYEGDVYDNRGNKTSFKDYKTAVTFNILVQERLNRLNTNRKPTSKEIQEIESEVESLMGDQD